MVKMHKSPTRRRFPCAGDVPRFHHSRVRQRRVFRRTAGSTQSLRSFCSFPRFRRWWRGHALCVTSRVVSHAKRPARRNSMNSFSLCDGLRVYVPRVGDTFHGKKERKIDSLSRRRTRTPSSRSREREREKACKILARKKWSTSNHSPKEKKLCSRSSRDDSKRRKRRRHNESERDSNEQLSPRRFARARNLRFNEKNNSRFKEAEECINASRRKRGRRIGRRRRRLEADDRRGGRRR